MSENDSYFEEEYLDEFTDFTPEEKSYVMLLITLKLSSLVLSLLTSAISAANNIMILSNILTQRSSTYWTLQKMSVFTQSTRLTQHDMKEINEQHDVIKDFDAEIDALFDSDKEQDDDNQWYDSEMNVELDESTTRLDRNELNNNVFFEEDVDFPPMVSTRGKQAGSIRYIWAGYMYSRDGYTKSFRCSNRQLYNCSGRAVIRNREVKETKEHTHPRDLHILQVDRIKQQMLVRAQMDRSVSLRSIYLEAHKNCPQQVRTSPNEFCGPDSQPEWVRTSWNSMRMKWYAKLPVLFVENETSESRREPLVRSRLNLDTMMSEMRRARNSTGIIPTNYHSKPSKKRYLNFEWAKDWLVLPEGKNKMAFCKMCEKKIVSPSKARLYNHFLSKMHKRAMLGLHKSRNKRVGVKKNESNPTDELKTTKRGNSGDSLSSYKDVIESQTHMKTHTVERIGPTKEFSLPPIESCQPVNENKTPECKNLISTISTHIWDSHMGTPISGLKISLYKMKKETWNFIRGMWTDEHGKCSDLLRGMDLTAGLYKMNLDTQSYYYQRKEKCLYPYIEIIFDVMNVNELYHFPIQLSPFGYNICRVTDA